MLLIVLMLGGCSLQGTIGPQPIGPLVLPTRPVAEPQVINSPGGPILEGPPDGTPIDNLERGLAQAQAVRTLVRQLAR